MSSSRDRGNIVITPSQRRQRTQWQRERNKQRAIILSGIIAIVFILAIPAYGYWSNFINPPKSVVLEIDDKQYTLGYIASYIKGLQELGVQPDLSTEPFRLIQMLEENELVRQGSEKRGLVVSSEEVDQEVKASMIGRSPKLKTVPEDQLDREFSETYTQYLDAANLSEDEHRVLVRTSLLRDKLREILGDEVPSVGEQVNVSWIVLSAEDPQKIMDIDSQIRDGVDFELLAEEHSVDRDSAVKGGEIGWVPEGSYPHLDQALFSLEVGDVSEPLSFGEITYFLKLNGKDSARDIHPDMRDRLKEVSIQRWLIEERSNHRIKMCFGGGSAGGDCDWQYDWLVKQIREAKRDTG